MKKKPWNLKPHERERLTDVQKIAALESRNIELLERIKQLEESNKYMSESNHQMRRDVHRYRYLRDKEVIVMDGEAKYLTGDNMDTYCDELREKAMFDWSGSGQAFKATATYNDIMRRSFMRWQAHQK